jgi:hypothetical protein
MFIVGCCLVILRKGELNKLTRHPKYRGKNHPNSRKKSRENDVGYVGWNLPLTNFTRWIVARVSFISS